MNCYESDESQKDYEENEKNEELVAKQESICVVEDEFGRRECVRSDIDHVIGEGKYGYLEAS